MMETKAADLKRQAHISGVLYLILAITGGYGIMYVPSQLVIRGDLALTTSNLLNHEFLFRSGILSNLIAQTVFLFLVLSLYKLFEKVDKGLVRTMFALVVVAVPISFFIIFNQLLALLLLKEDFTKLVVPKQMQVTTMSLLRFYDYGTVVIGIFWGLWLIPFGQLMYKSGLMPKVLGILLIVGGLAYVVDAATFVLFPDWHSFTGSIVGIASSLAELSTVLWLLIMGVSSKKQMA